MPKLTNSNACTVLNNSDYIKTHSTIYHVGAFAVGKKVYTNPNLTSPLPAGTYGIGNDKFTVGLEGVVISTNLCDGDYTTTFPVSTTNASTNISSTTITSTTFPVSSTTLPSTIIVIGHWTISTRRLVLVPYSSGYFLAETDLDYNYLTPRGKNFWYDNSITKYITDQNYENYDPKNNNTGSNGTNFPANFPESETLAKGYIRFEDEFGNLVGYAYVKPGFPPIPPTTTLAPTTTTTVTPTTTTTLAPTTTSTTTTTVVPTTTSTTSAPTTTTSTTTASPSIITIGYWISANKILVLVPYSTGYFLAESDVDYNYLTPRGRNLWYDDNRVTKYISDGAYETYDPKNDNTGIGGVQYAPNYPIAETLAKGYIRQEDEFGNLIDYGYVKPGFPPTTTSPPITTFPGDTVSLLGIPSFPEPSGNNTVDWTPFSNFTVPLGILNNGGYGFSLWKDELTDGGTGKLNLFSKGWTNLVNLNAFDRSKWAELSGGDWTSKRYYYFQQVWYLMNHAINDCITNGYNGVSGGTDYGNMNLAFSGDFQNRNINYSGITIDGAKKIGEFMQLTVSNSLDDPAWNLGVWESIIMLDEESMTSYSWAGGDHYSFLGYISQGMWTGSSQRNKLFWYAQPVSRWLHTNEHNFYSLTDDQIDAAFQDSNIVYNSPGWLASKFYTDANGAYSKTPYPSNVSIYAKDGGGNFIIEGGKRKYRDQDFTVNIYGNNVPILKEPDEFIKYAIQHGSTGEQRFGASYFNIDGFGNGTIKSEWVSAGYGLHPLARPYANSWRTESEYFVENSYKRADGIVGDLLCLNRLDKGQWDLSTVLSDYKLCQVERPKTEPWTPFGNSINAREIGKTQSFFDTFCLAYSGGLGFDTWDDGRYWGDDMPTKGNILYPDNGSDYFARYTARLAAFRTAYADLQGTDPSTWKFVHFYQPYIGRKYKEVISQGIYYNGKLHAYFLNPSLEHNEIQSLQMVAGGTAYNFSLTGHEFYYRSFDVPNGLNVEDFTLEYTTIYGRHVRVCGKVTNSRHNHYLLIA